MNVDDGLDDDIQLLESKIPLPKEYRKKTDTIFFYVFAFIFLVWFGISIYAISSTPNAPKIDQNDGSKNRIIGYNSFDDVHNIRTRSIYTNYDNNNGRSSVKPIDIINLLKKCSVAISVSLLVSGILIILEIYLLRWYAGIVVWSTIYLILLIFIVVGTIFIGLHFYVRDDGNNVPGALYFGLVFYVVAIVYLILLALYSKKIPLVIELIREASKAIGDVSCTLFFPLFPLVLQTVVIVFSGLSFAYITEKMNSSNSKAGFDGELFTALLIFYVFCTFWTIFFINGTIDMVLGGCYNAWYWAKPKSSLSSTPVLDSLKMVVKFHLGTVALGSVVMALLALIKVLVNMITRGRKCENCCCGIFKRFFHYLQNLLSYFNRNVYIYTMLHGTNFITGAKSVFKILTSNIIQILLLKRITSWVLSIAQLIIAGIAYGIAYGIINGVDADPNDSNINNLYYSVPIMTMVMSLYVTSFFTSTFTIAIDSMFICFVEDRKMNDGSELRPYYMSKNLAVVFKEDE